MSDWAPPLTEPAPAALPAPPVQDTRWRTLLLYLLAGFGLFILAGLVVTRLTGSTPTNTILASLVAYLVNFLCFAGAAYFLGLRLQNLTWADFGLRSFPWRSLAVWLVAAVLILPLRAVAALVAQVFLGGGLEALDARMDLIVPQGGLLGLNLVLTVLGAGILAPMAEELYFRGLIHRWFWARLPGSPALRVVLSSVIFALGHYDSVGVVASTFFLGLLCALAYERTRSLWVTIIIHAVNNTLAVLLLYAVAALAPV